LKYSNQKYFRNTKICKVSSINLEKSILTPPIFGKFHLWCHIGQ
jgi:hypothetical protein